ncbi:MAG: hypothetical protein U0U66_11440 [Cytophagaceae bacterium]
MRQAITKITIVFILGIVQQQAFAQDRSWLLHVMVYKVGNFTYLEEGGTSPEKFKGGIHHPTLELHFTDSKWYIDFAAFTSVLSDLSSSKGNSSPAFDFGWGWHIIKKESAVTFGLGFNFGLYGMYTRPPQNQIDATPFYIGPTISANIQIGEKLNIQNTLRLNYSGEKRTHQYSGSALCFMSLISYKLSNRFGLSVKPAFNNYYFESSDSKQQDTEFKYKIKEVQFGVCISLD